MSRLFISHSSFDNFEALAFKQWLIAEGWAPEDVFIDLHGIGAGARWKEALAKANERCEAVLFLISPRSLASNECYVELRMAEDLGKVIVPTILPPRVPEDRLTVDDQRLAVHRERQIVDASIEPREASFTVEHEGQRRTIAFHAPTLARIKARLDQLGISPDSFAWTPANLETATPYPGLAGFAEGEAALFFGRAGDIARGFASLRKLRRATIDGGQGAILVIQAASGAGKSSFLKAGLWPRLGRDPDFTPIAILRPATGILTGDTGIGRQFAAFLARHNRTRPAADIHPALLSSDVDALATLAALIREAADIGRETQRLTNTDAPPPTPIIAVDQAEELFAADDADESRRFLALLAGVMGTGTYAGIKLDPPPLFVWTVRADSMDTLLHTTTTHGLGAPELFPLPPMARTSYAEIINGPLTVANRAGMRLSMDPLLTQKLIAEADGADALPLLAYTLRQLVEDNRSGARAQISLEAFEAGGGIGGVLLKRLAIAQRKVGADNAKLRALFVPRLATWDADARPPAAKRLVVDETELLAGERASLKPLADALVDERLLTRGGDESGHTTLEVAHEALLRQAPLADWLEETREFLIWRDGIARARRGFEANTRPHLIGRELEIARGWLGGAKGRDIAAEDRSFIEASVVAEERVRSEAAERERQRQQAELEATRAREQVAHERSLASIRLARRTTAGFAVALILAAFTALFAYQSKRQADQLQAINGELLVERATAQTQRKIAEAQRNQAEGAARNVLLIQSKYLADVASAEFFRPGSISPEAAALYALEALRDENSDVDSQRTRPYHYSAEVALEHALRNIREKQVLSGHAGGVASLVVLPDGRLASGSGDNTIRLWDLKGNSEPVVLKGHENEVSSLVVLPDGRLASGSGDATIRLWDPTGNGEPVVLKGHEGPVVSLVVLPDGRLASGAWDSTIRLWDLKGNGEPVVLKGHESTVASLVVLPDGRLASGAWDSTIRLWDLKGNGEPVVLKGHESTVASLVVLPDGRLASGAWDSTIRLWDLTGNGEPVVLKGHERWVTSLVVLPDGRLASGSDDATIRLWDLKGNGEPVVLKGHESAVLSLVVLPDGRLASGSRDSTIRLWDLKGIGEPVVLKGHEDAVLSLVVLPDGRLASGSRDNTIRLWDLKGNGEPVALKGHENDVSSLVVLPDGRLASGSVDTTIRLWKIYPQGQALVEMAKARLPRCLSDSERRAQHLEQSPNPSCAMTAGPKIQSVWFRAHRLEL